MSLYSPLPICDISGTMPDFYNIVGNLKSRGCDLKELRVKRISNENRYYTGVCVHLVKFVSVKELNSFKLRIASGGREPIRTLLSAGCVNAVDLHCLENTEANTSYQLKMYWMLVNKYLGIFGLKNIIS